MRASTRTEPGLLDKAEKSLADGDAVTAQKLAEQALQGQAAGPGASQPDASQPGASQEDQGRALFVLAKAASLNKDMAGARKYFERTLEVAHQPRLLAWSHIYLGRICDLQENRDAAVGHYRAAMSAGDPAPEVKAAAERGLRKAYEPPARPQ